MQKGVGTMICQDCGGTKKTKESRFCYKCRTSNRPSGLNYVIKVVNKGWIKNGDKRNLGIKRSEEYKRNMSEIFKGIRRSPETEFTTERTKGSKNSKWMGDKVGYDALHGWVKRNYQWGTSCELCGSGENLNLASKDWSYTRERDSWWILCYKCHRQYDLKNNWGLATKLFKL